MAEINVLPESVPIAVTKSFTCFDFNLMFQYWRKIDVIKPQFKILSRNENGTAQFLLVC
jgi:hypothetical protein